MRYDTLIENEEQLVHRTRRTGTDGAASSLRRPDGTVRSFPPVVQILTPVDPALENKVEELVWKGHRSGRDLEEICGAVHTLLRRLDINPAISVQEVYTSNMPSFAGETISTALILVDLRTA